MPVYLDFVFSSFFSNFFTPPNAELSLCARYNNLILTYLDTDFTTYALVRIDINSPFPLMAIFGLTGSLTPTYSRAVDIETHLTAAAVVSGDDIDRVFELFKRLSTT